MLQEKQLHIFTYIPIFRLSLIDLRYYIATVLRPCCSPTSRRLIKDLNTLIHDIIIYEIYCKKEKFRWIMYVFSEKNPVDIFTKAFDADLHHHCVLGMSLRPFYPR